MHIPTSNLTAIKQVWKLIQQDDYAFSVDLRDAYIDIPIFKHHCHFLHFVNRKLLSIRFFHLG